MSEIAGSKRAATLSKTPSRVKLATAVGPAAEGLGNRRVRIGLTARRLDAGQAPVRREPLAAGGARVR
jgi:hypothetical protein